MKRRDLMLGAAAAGLAAPALGQNSNRVLKFIPHANLSSPDPVWTTSAIAFDHGNMVWDRLYALTEKLDVKYQMLAGDEVSKDGLTWRLKLRDGLAFHDGEPVRAADCIASLTRWAKRDGFGQRMLDQLNEMKVVDDKTWDINLKRPYPHLPFAIAQGSSFIMPERIAKTDAFQQITEYVGSGPFRFIKDEWVAGSQAIYTRFDKYVPRQEPADSWAGGKVAHFDRVEWKIVPDPATASAALQRGEVDWWELPLSDLLPQLKKAPGVKVSVFDPLGWIGVVAINHLHPPFNNPAIRRAVLHALNQQDYVDAAVGNVPEYGKAGVGYFCTGTPNESKAGMEALLSKRDPDKARKALAEAGYKGEKVLVMGPPDLPVLMGMAQVTEAMLRSIGMNVELLALDWGTIITRRASQEPPEKGGWNLFTTTWTGQNFLNPGNHYPLRGNGTKGGWFGWNTDEKMEALREKWFESSDPAEQKRICEDMQVLAFQNVPFYPVGHWYYPTAYRDNLSGFQRAALTVFWNVKKG